LPREYFDISDLVSYARANRTVSGIQRVQVRVLERLAANGGESHGSTSRDAQRCLFATGGMRPLRACHVAELFGTGGYEAGRFLSQLGIDRPTDAFTRRELTEHLARYRKGSATRALSKIRLQLLGRVAPAATRARMGLPPRTGSSATSWCAAKRIRTSWNWRLQPADTLVLIGTNWNVSRIESLARRHAERGGRVIQVVYDLIPLRHPEYCIDSLARKFTAYLRRSLSFTSRYVCISEATAADMRGYLHEQGANTEVMVWPLAHEFEGYPRNHRGTIPTDTELLPASSEPFVLCVGTIEVRKNGVFLLEAWQRLIHELGDRAPRLVFAGKYGWKIEAFCQRLERDERLRERVSVVATPTDSDLAALYERCLFTVYPSLVEGWGLPVGEAAWFGKVTVASSSSSLPEVLGPLADYARPDDLDGFAQAVRRIVENAEYRTAREREITAAPLRTWADVAADLRHCIR
jgi:glycosyltransferase involved in cell wall biosynthesis